MPQPPSDRRALDKDGYDTTVPNVNPPRAGAGQTTLSVTGRDHRVRVTRHDSERGRWETTTGAPGISLRDYVIEYRGFEENATTFARRRELPSDRTALIIGLGPSMRVIDPRSPTMSTPYDGPFLTGAWDTYALTELDSGWRGLQVDFTPMGAYRIFGVPMNQLANRVVELHDIVGSMAGRLVEQLTEAPRWEACFTILDSVLSDLLVRGRESWTGVAWAWRTLRESGGRISIGALSAKLGCSRKHLIAQFRRQVGLPPKMLARIIRFNRVVRLFEDDCAATSWADLAYRCGYADQAHLIKDFHQFAGGPPRELLVRWLPDGGGMVGDDRPVVR